MAKGAALFDRPPVTAQALHFSTGVYSRKNEHQDVHNLYNLLWNKSIWDGYVEKRGTPDQLGRKNVRPLILTRSGAAGTQRYGAAMWSGDIGSNLGSLAAHHNAQLHMSLSGIDYYGADVGGFRREALPGNHNDGYRGYEGELYTQWFANGAWFDIPLRPHTDNEFRQTNPPYETAPHRVGDRASNRANLRQRYELTPYYYSLAYRAHLFGEPVVPPLVFYYQTDPRVRKIGHEKLIGKDLLVGVVARHGEYERDVYLPAGTWVNYHAHEWHDGGKVVENVPVYRDGLFRLPTFARAGAILPLMTVDDRTKDTFGHRTDGTAPPRDLIVKVFADKASSAFTLYEDDGLTLQYDGQGRPRYHFRRTKVRQQQTGDAAAAVTVDPAEDPADGPYPGAPAERHRIVRLVVRDARGSAVQLNGTPLAEVPSEKALAAAASGWCNAGPNQIVAKSPSLPVAQKAAFTFELKPLPKTTSVNFVCANGFTTPGTSVYVVGSLPELGAWDPAKAVKLSPSVYYQYVQDRRADHGHLQTPVWTAVVPGLPPDTAFEWKFIRRREDGTGAVEWEQGPNHRHRTGAAGFAGRAAGSF